MHSAMTMEDTEVLAIKSSRFEKIIKKYSHIKDEIEKVAAKRSESTTNAINIARRAGFKINEER